MGRKLLACLLSLALTLPLAGCWDHLEVSKMLIIAGIGLDSVAGGQLYHATVEIVNVEAEGGQNIAAELVEGWGVTLHGAIQDAMTMTGGVMFGNHCKAIVLGDALAREGVAAVVETVLRNPQYRKTVDLLIARDATAAEILRSKTVNNDIISYELASIAKSNADTARNTLPTGVYELHEALLSDCAYAVVPAVTLRQNNGRAVPEVDGCAVFTGDRLCGYLSGSDVRTLSLLLRGARGAVLPVAAPGLSARPLDLSLTSGRVKLTAGPDGTQSLQVSLAAAGTLRDAVAGGLDLNDAATVAAVERAAGDALARQIERLIARVQTEYGADIFGFYRVFQDVLRAEWPAVADDWGARFAVLTVSVSCTVKLTGSGLIGSYSRHDAPGGGGNALP